MRTIISCLLTLALAMPSFGQSEPPYKQEWLYGLNFHTNGGLIGGFMLKYSKARSARSFHSFPLEVVNIKHPKELKIFPLSGANSYIQGKSNSFYLLRPLYGMETILFRKAEQQGVQVNAFFGVGPNLGIVAPYYIRYNGLVAQFDPAVHNVNPNAIEGAFDFGQSIKNASFKFGGSAKASIYFEMGTSRRNVGGFEAGLTVDAFPKQIVIIPEAQNRSVFTAAFLSFYYGIRS